MTSPAPPPSVSDAVEALSRLLRAPPDAQSPADSLDEARGLEGLAVALASGHDPAAGSEASVSAMRELFRALVTERLMSPSYVAAPGEDGAASAESVLRVLQCARLLLRDRWFVRELVAVDGAVAALGGKYRAYAVRHWDADDAAAAAAGGEKDERARDDRGDRAKSAFGVEILSELASVFKKLASDGESCPWRVLHDAAVPTTAAGLLPTRDASLLASALVTLCVLVAASEECAVPLLASDGLDHLLHILLEYAPPFKHLAGDLLHLVCRLRDGRREVRRLGGVTLVLGSLHAASGDEIALEASLRVLGGLLSDSAAAAETRAVGGVPILVSMLAADADARTGGGGGRMKLKRLGSLGGEDEASGGGMSTVASPAVTCLLCGALTKLASDDEGGAQIRQCNGVYLLGRLLTDTHAASTSTSTSSSDGSANEGPRPLDEVQAHAFRAMRYLFSVERNRKVFKRLFPPALFAAFIDVGHYQSDVKMYRPLAARWRELGADAVRATRKALEDINRVGGVGAEKKIVRGYVLEELLGAGAFGSVYRVHKERSKGTMCAMKALNPEEEPTRFGTTPEEITRSVGRVASEVNILSRLSHPNIVRYHESFNESGTLYIVMELVEGASLLDHLTSTAEKGRRMSEESAWNVFLQVVLALHYIHVEKNVVHRDLTPNNILLEDDTRRVKIADFGLAKAYERDFGAVPAAPAATPRERRNAEVMQSAVGTMPYSCPEIIMHEAYGAKADVWSLGCVLYHMLALRPPFDASNPITMASAIVEGRYPSLEPLVARIGGGDRKGSGGPYSAALVGLVGRLMTIDKEKRPSISEVAAASAPYLMRSMDKIQSDNDRLREDAIREGRRRAADSTLERRKREALRKLTGLAHDDDDGAGSSGAATGDVSETETDASGDGDAAAAGDRATNSGSGARSGSGASTPRLNSGRSFKIAPDRLRAVADPLSQILSTLHKLVFIDQLPPGSRRDPRRASIVRYKRALFAGSNHAGFIKAEAAKLSAGSREEVAIGDARLLGGGDGACTYETLGRAMEELLREHRFYQLGARGNDA